MRLLSDDELPDLNAMPRSEWRAALKPLTDMDRRCAVGRIRGQDAVTEGMALIGFLMLEDPAPIVDVPVPRLPAGAAVTERRRTRGRTRVVSFRLSHHEYDRLAALAGELALRPTTLARLLAVRGVEATWREHAA